MIIDYLSQFPIPEAELPPRLRGLLEPVAENPRLGVEVTLRFDFDQYGPDREFVHMVMAAVPEAEINLSEIREAASEGVVAYSTPDVRAKGELADFSPSVSGFDYIVASWGDNSFYSFNLSEKVWMALGLSARSLGGDHQKIFYDDLSLPEFGVANGEISTEYYFSPKRNVRWTMTNEYLRRYLWMRGAYGVRVFFYEALMLDTPGLRAVMKGQEHIYLKPDGDWYALDIREFKGGLLVQVWAAVAAVSPELCPEMSADGLLWPGYATPMTYRRADAVTDVMPVYLDDQFLERYEQNSLFDTTPVRAYGRWLCSPSYRGQWGFTDCVRVGRNLIKVPMRELYKPKPDREILRAHAHALDSAHVAMLDKDEEHVVAKTERLVNQLLDLGEHLADLCDAVGVQNPETAIFRITRAELRANGWSNFPELSRLAQVAPLAMTEQAFLSRCKNIHELWQRIPNGLLRELVARAGHARSDIKGLGSLKLLQALSNIVERLNADGERADAFGAGADPDDLATRNGAIAPLFINNDLRIVDAHDAGEVLTNLENLDFDVAAVNQGYGLALDHVFDEVIRAFSHLNTELDKLLNR